MKTITGKKNWAKSCRNALCALAVLCLPINLSHAATLVPGSSIPASAELDPIGGSLLNTITIPFSTTSFTGTLTSSVYSGDTSNPFGLGDLTFTYKLLLSSGPDSASAVSVGPFTGFQTDVSFQTASGGIDPGTISRNPSGSQAVKFDFSSVGYLSPGANSALLVVQTDATAWTSGNATVLDSTGSPNVTTLSPNVVPEPSSIGLITLGFAVLAGYRRWKK